MTDKQAKCGNCKFYGPITQLMSKQGYCRFNAPVAADPHNETARPAWPMVSSKNFCGQFYPATPPKQGEEQDD